MEAKQMRFSYNKLWKLLIDCGINKKALREMSGVSATSVAKLGKGANVNTDVLLRICNALNCDVGDIMEFVNEDIRDKKMMGTEKK
jgi:DNA-binding Xre family transcriptional regulator